MKRLYGAHWRLLPHHILVFEIIASVFLAVVVFNVQQADAYVIRLQNRSLLVQDTQPGVTTSYKVSYAHNSLATTGSVRMLFCIDPIPHHPCVPPDGLDVSGAVLIEQMGETGYAITNRTTNELVLSRPPSLVSANPSSYTFANIKNPTYKDHSFSIRLSTYASNDATGPVIDLGSVVNIINEAIGLETQVPPILIFCLAQRVEDDCETATGGNFSDMGELSPDQTALAESQMAVGTNASGGFVITANGSTLTAGQNEIDALKEPTQSQPGQNQFGINLVQNSTPTIGGNADGDSMNANAAIGYDQPNRFMFRDGDVVASAPNVSLIRRFTTSYIVNIKNDLPAGVYATSITFICSGRF